MTRIKSFYQDEGLSAPNIGSWARRVAVGLDKTEGTGSWYRRLVEDINAGTDLGPGSWRTKTRAALDQGLLAPSPSFQPPAIGGLLIHIDPNEYGLSEGDPVTELPDLTGSGRVGTLPAGRNAATIETRDGGKALHFETTPGGTQLGQDARTHYTFAPMGAQAGMDVFVVLENKSAAPPGGDRGLWYWGTSVSTGSDAPHYTWSDGTIYESAIRSNRISFTPGTSVTTKHVYEVAASSWVARVNGVVRYSDGSGYPNSGSTSILGFNNANDWHNGWIWEMLVYSRRLSDVDRFQVQTYLNDRHGLALPTS